MFEIILCAGGFYAGWKYGDKVVAKIKSVFDKTDVDEKVIDTVEAIVEAVVEIIDDEK